MDTKNKEQASMGIKALVIWLAASFVLTMAALMAYAAAQQLLRQSANWPQVQLARDGAAKIAAGGSAESVAAGDKVDAGQSLAPFVIVYDKDGNAAASSGLINGETPKLPAGILDYTAKNGEDRVTWMPNRTVRIAAVVEPVTGGQGGYVLAGRSLEESERTTDNIGKLLLLMWAGSEAVMLAASVLYYSLFRKKQ